MPVEWIRIPSAWKPGMEGPPRSDGESTIPVEESISLTKRMKECKNWRKCQNAGCGKSRCLAGRGDQQGIVTYRDCFACLREQDEAATEADRQFPGTSGS